MMCYSSNGTMEYYNIHDLLSQTQTHSPASSDHYSLLEIC